MLDIGCGNGSFMIAAQAAGWNVKGTERNPHPARRLGLYAKESIAEIGDASKFDCITMWHTLEHFRDIKSTLTSLERLIFMQAQRYWVERSFQDAKVECGLDDYQARKWRSWQHHMAMVMMAMLFLIGAVSFWSSVFFIERINLY